MSLDLASFEPARLKSRLGRAHHRLKLQATFNALSPFATAWHLANGGIQKAPDRSTLRALKAELDKLIDADWQNLEAGHYPSALVDWPFLDYVKTAPELFADLPKILKRRQEDRFDELPEGCDPERYPPYYQRTFHWQTDGWLSAHSARIYELSVELLFHGTANVMRRMALPPLAEALRGAKRPRVLDIACGTGAFLRSVRAVLPDARLYGIDLSPAYIAHAKAELADLHDVNLLAENAEHLPFADATFDAAYSIFLFHELPRDARRNVLFEAKRVLKPGATLVLADSFQYSDPQAKGLGFFLEWFPQMYHEPYYKGYVREDLGDLAAECGFEVEDRRGLFLTKRVVCRKPQADRQ